MVFAAKGSYVDPPYIGDKLHHARNLCGDYEVHLKELGKFREKHPNIEII